MDFFDQDEVVAIGNPWHGQVSADGILALPNGGLLTVAGPVEPHSHLVQFDDLPVPFSSPGDAAAGREWRSYAILAGRQRRYSPKSATGIGLNSWLFRSPGGHVWALRVVDGGGQMKVMALRFGMIGRPAGAWVQLASASVDAATPPTFTRFVSLTADRNGRKAAVNICFSIPSDAPLPPSHSAVRSWRIGVSGGADETPPTVTVEEIDLGVVTGLDTAEDLGQTSLPMNDGSARYFKNAKSVTSRPIRLAVSPAGEWCDFVYQVSTTSIWTNIVKLQIVGFDTYQIDRTYTKRHSLQVGGSEVAAWVEDYECSPLVLEKQSIGLGYRVLSDVMHYSSFDGSAFNYGYSPEVRLFVTGDNVVVAWRGLVGAVVSGLRQVSGEHWSAHSILGTNCSGYSQVPTNISMHPVSGMLAIGGMWF